MKPQKENQEDGVVCLSVSVISDESNHLNKTVSMTDGEISGRTNERNVKDNFVSEYIINSKEELCAPSHLRLTYQVLGSIVIALTNLGVSCINGFSGVTLPQLTKPDSEDIYLSPSDAALFGSMVNLGAALGSILGGPFVVRFGQRLILLVFLPVSLLFWLLQAFTLSLFLIFVSRFFLGVATGIISASSSTYVMEMAHQKHRGWLFSIVSLTGQFGYLFLSCIGSTSLSWRHLSLICGIVTTLPSFVGLFFFPNSPRWLVTRNRISDAEKSLIFFRGENYDVTCELKDIINEVGEQQTTDSCNILEQFCMLRKKHIFPKFFIVFFITLVATLNGSFIIGAYIVPIFQSTSSGFDSYFSTIIVSAVRVIGTLVGSVIIDHFERKKLVVISYLFNAISLSALGTYFYCDSHNWNLSSFGWLPLLSLVCYIFSLSVSIPVTALLRGELLPSTVRSAGYSVLITVMYSGGFVVTLMYPQMTEALGQYGSFWIYSVACLIISTYSLFAVPLTRGRSLEEISSQTKHKLNTKGKAGLPQ